MVIRKHGKKWQCLVRVKGVSVTQSFVSKSDARLWGQKTEVDISNGVYLKNLKLVEMRLKDLLHLYLEKAMHKSKRPKILKYDVEMLRRTPLARYSLMQLSPVKICEFRDDRLRAGKSPSTVRNYMKLLSRAITIGQKELGIPLQSNPFKMVEYPRPAPARERTLNTLELNRLFKACDACSMFHFLRSFVECAYLTLCRRGELIKLSRHDVDWSNSTAILKETKDNNKSRVIGLSPRVVELLQKLPRSVDGQFFPVRSISAFEKAFGRAVKRAELKDFRMHDIRHTGATDLAEQGWSTVELMQQGGWTSAAMVKRYANISPRHLARKLKQG
jgi:integrase